MAGRAESRSKVVLHLNTNTNRNMAAASRWAARTVLSSQPKQHSATLVLYHGFGADAANFASALRLPPQVTNHVKIVLPQA